MYCIEYCMCLFFLHITNCGEIFYKTFLYSAYSQWWGYVRVHTGAFSDQLNTLIQKFGFDCFILLTSLMVVHLILMSFYGGVFDGWLWCVERSCVVRTWKKNTWVEYFLFGICLSVFIKICRILMIIWTCLSRSIWHACISYWFNHKGCIGKCEYGHFCPYLYSVLFIYD